jgi:uncharacterized membrane protein YcaP (DUF421 family)
MTDVFSIAYRSIAVYIFIIIAIRIFGKKELSQLSLVDLVLILLISNSVQNAMVGNNSSLLGGLTAAFTLFIVNWLLKQFMFKSKKISRLLQGEPLTLVYHGKIIKEGLDKAKITNDELMEAIREHGVENVKEVDLAVLEVDGVISVLSENFRKKSKHKRRVHKSLSLKN